MFMVWSKQSARKTEKKAIRNALASKTDLFFFAFFVKRRSARGERKGESRIRWVLFSQARGVMQIFPSCFKKT